MAVKVTTTQSVSGGEPRVDTHGGGNDFFVEDGHLTVIKSQGEGSVEHIAVYAPGQWLQAVAVQRAAK